MTRIARAGALLALALLTALALGAAPASAKDWKGEQRADDAEVMPKGWAKRTRAKGGAKADPDDDGLSNWGEWRARTKPRKADSDRDWIADGDEDWSDQDDADCAAELAPAAVVHEAELEDGGFWTVELVLADQVRPS